MTSQSTSSGKSRALVAGIYGLAVIGSGLMRFLQQPDGEKGLWFGLVMGSIALFAAFYFAKSKRLLARILIWLSMLLVGGWFVFEALIDKGYQSAEPRMLVIIGLTLATAVYFLFQCWPKGNTSPEQNT